ncbi:hypothetical protein EZJ43_00250 [Pedobacter changchengzhani]|uniref:Uncharacterized protein n=1 Tax=Pedobacter changchengzhani TaxID=2529274 RepID=A0A4R5MP46_9SPHI|nr:hypothetical protein [Pedobacter changchengzhani]TDG37561.1 hypothetical protein EZJ43_00250 [Pedobacter changchengzhani]
MTFSDYPILIALLLLLFYLFGRKKKETKEVASPEIPFSNTGINYAVETDLEFTDRCYNFLTEWFAQNNIVVYISPNRKVFRITFQYEDGFNTDYFVESCYAPNKKVLIFCTNLSGQIPDHKLSEISELINRMNEFLLVGCLYLNYEKRRVESQLLYYVGTADLNAEYLAFNYGMMVGLEIRNAVHKIVEYNELPAIVAMDWPN